MIVAVRPPIHTLRLPPPLPRIRTDLWALPNTTSVLMGLDVLAQIAALGKRHATPFDRALERLLARVRPHMNRERRLNRKRLAAAGVSARKGLLIRVRANVLNERSISQCRKAMRNERTHLSQCRTLAEPAPTLAAYEWLVAHVRPHMSDDLLPLCEASPLLGPLASLPVTVVYRLS